MDLSKKKGTRKFINHLQAGFSHLKNIHYSDFIQRFSLFIKVLLNCKLKIRVFLNYEVL